MMKPTRHILVRDWKQDTVYLVTYPRTGTIPNLSPWSLKLETFIRFNQLNYVVVNNEFKYASTKGQVPFVEINGRQFADSSYIIENLIAIFNLPIDGKLSTRERAAARAFHKLIEESLYRAIAYDRCRDNAWFFTEKGWGAQLHGVKKFFVQNVAQKLFLRKMKGILQAHGIGRNSPEEVDEIFKKDLTALSAFLGDKPYFFGDRPSTIDATLFGGLAQLMYNPLNSQVVKPFMEQSTPNLVGFVNRIKAEYWPDWNDIITGLLLNPGDTPVHSAASATSHASKNK
ncbi:failed axon connections protein [Aphelenchoides avenae]|nr:failed axon connections protein [Aphelenchus avenae]